MPTKSYFDSLHEINRNRRGLILVFNDQDNESTNTKLTTLDSVAVKKNPSSGNEVSNKKQIDEGLDKNTIVRFAQTLTNHLKVSFGKVTDNITKYDKLQIIDTTGNKFPNIGSDLIQKWNNKGKNNINDSKVGNFLKSTITNSPTGHS